MKAIISLVTAAVLAITAVTSCSTSPTGRKTVKLFPSSELAALGAASFDDLKSQQQLSTNSADISYVNCVSQALIAELPEPYRSANWEIQVFASDQVNAFALPGEKIGVYTGLLDVAENQHELAAVIGHEIGHVIAEHSNERMTAQVGAGLALQVGGALAYSELDEGSAAVAMMALGLGVQIGGILPFSRVHESESDQLGVDYMIAAGFDPNGAANLWRNMAAANPNSVPEWLSTHPTSSSRIAALTAYTNQVYGRYQQARAQGKRPNCVR
ncbi:M48 family metallopeptidase [Pseudidiomarina mangrovi]|uniref:M48 family metallopeptidase n=1 Tax=Pseudidiomarina mangrovi TaxID=2487133 RepID=UPI00196A3508|nr:M48 family metallopeptidase [Pseudidiomarina mangrovi]